MWHAIHRLYEHMFVHMPRGHKLSALLGFRFDGVSKPHLCYVMRFVPLVL